MEEKIYEFALACIDGIGISSVNRLINHTGNVKEAFELNEKVTDELLKAKEAEAFKRRKSILYYAKEYEKNERNGIFFTCITEDDYPEKLKNIPEAPYGIFYRGKLPNPKRKTVAIVGARNCSEYGRGVAYSFGKELAENNIDIISGMALGVDSASQRGALDGNGETYGIMGCGPDICYPESNRFVYDRICMQGGILSEYKPGTKPSAGLFPRRNRIISGLSDIVLVVEARKRSGTYITVTQALGQGKDVYAVPGRITDSLSEGCNGLLKEGAAPATSPDDILCALGIETNQKEKANSGKVDPILEAVSFSKGNFDEIMCYLNKKNIIMEPGELLYKLMQMTIEGQIENEGGFYYIGKNT